jgi:hypothetical protein
MKPLDRVFQGWPISLFEDICPYFDDIIRPKPDEKLVEGGMMKITEGNTVWDDRFTGRLRVRNNMRRVQ